MSFSKQMTDDEFKDYVLQARFQANDARKAEIAAKEREALRDQFAMAALTGLLSKSGPTTNFSNDARNAYFYADAMLKQREKNDG